METEKNPSKESKFSEIVYKHFGPKSESKRLAIALDFMIYFVGLLGTILALPQAYAVWIHGESSILSLYSWISLAAFPPFWIIYGLVNKQRALALTYLLWLVIDLIVILGILQN